MAVVGMTLRQLPGFAFRSPTDYANEMDRLHGIYDATLTTGVVDLLERLQLFRVFSSIWFSVGLIVLILSIVACTIDRLPRLWRQSADIRVVQPDPYYDPSLPDRAALAGVVCGCDRLDPPPPPVRGPARGRRRDDVPVRRPSPLDEDGDPPHPYRARAVPRRGSGDLAAGRRAGPGRRRRRLADGPAHRDAWPPAGAQPRLRRSGLHHRHSRRTSRPTSRCTRTAGRSPTRSSA